MIGNVYVCDDHGSASKRVLLSTMNPLGDGRFAFRGSSKDHILCREIATISVLENLQVPTDLYNVICLQKCLVLMKNHDVRIVHMLLEMNLWMMKRVGDER